MRMCNRPQVKKKKNAPAPLGCYGLSACEQGSVVGGVEGRGGGTDRASPADMNQCGGSWVMFVNTH